MITVCDKFCDKCAFRKKFSCGLYYCDYFCMTDRRRPCPAGEGCTVRVEQKVYRKQKRTPEQKAAFAQEQRKKEAERKRVYYELNRERILERNRRYQKERKAQMAEYARARRKRIREGRKKVC